MSAVTPPIFDLNDPLPTAMLCLEASAGTGKTYTIEGLATRLVAEDAVPIEALLIVTFTRAATSELKTRVRKVLNEAKAGLEAALSGQALDPEAHAVVAVLLSALPDEAARQQALGRLSRAIEGFDEAQISTIHGFCRRALQEHAFDSGAPFDVELVDTMKPLYEEIAQDWWTDSRFGEDPHVLAHMEVREISIKTFINLVKAATNEPDAAVCPPRPTAAQIAAWKAPWDQAFARFQSQWAQHRDDVVATLDEAVGRNALNKPYKDPGNNAATADRLDVWLSQTDPYPGVPEALGYFTDTTVQSKINKRPKVPPVVTHELFVHAQALVDAALQAQAGLDLVLLDRMHGLRDHALVSLEARKQSRRIMAYTDLLEAMHARVTGPEANQDLIDALRGRYQVALIDEFQDTDPIQWGIFKAIFSRLIVVGDPKQAIYAFRGADIDTYLSARESPGMETRTLGTNHRSDEAVVDGVSHLFTRSEVTSPFRNDAIQYPPVSARHTEERFWSGEGRPPGIVFSYLRRAALPKQREDKAIGSYKFGYTHPIVAAQVAAYLASKPKLLDDKTGEPRVVRSSDIAILVRRNEAARELQGALRSLGISSTLRGEQSVLASDEASELIQFLTGILESTRSGPVRNALATRLLGADLSTIAALQDDDQGWNDWMARFRQWRQLWFDKGFATFARAVTTTPLPVPGDGADQTIPTRLLGWRDGERRVTNLLHLFELLHEASLGGGLTPTALVTWLRAERQDELERASDDRRQLRLESDRDAVTIVTIHKSKGLQYPIVWCPYLWSGAFLGAAKKLPLRFRDPSAGGRYALDLDADVASAGKLDNIALWKTTERQEALRMLYVALTRARHQVHVFYGPLEGLGESPLGHLVHPGHEVPESLDDDALYAELEALADSSGGTIVAEQISTLPTAQPLSQGARPGANPQARAYGRRSDELDTLWRRTSFSGLVKNKGHEETGEPADRDATPEEGEEEAVEDAPPTEDAPAVVVVPEDTLASTTDELVLKDFKGGTRAGTCIHKIYELHDFREPEALAELVSEQLTAFRFDAKTWTEPVTANIQASLQTPLGPALGLPADFCLAQLTPERRFDELDFVFPLHADGTDYVSARAIGECLAAHGGPGMPPGYPEKLQKLKVMPGRGFMVGSIDLVFEQGGKWYVVDYKSNNLGIHPADYTTSHLAEAMSHSHYVLQYHIYCVALHRYLSWRLGTTYRFETHFGGALYLFMRGMSPEHPAGVGVFQDAPSRALIEALSALMGGDP